MIYFIIYKYINYYKLYILLIHVEMLPIIIYFIINILKRKNFKVKDILRYFMCIIMHNIL